MNDSLPALIFDLDGTLTDSKPGILGCLREVLAARAIHDAGPLDRFVGPPVEEWATELLPHGSPDDRLALARDYRACYDRVGWSNNALFPGIAELLLRLEREGLPLYVCTSKQHHFAVRILEHFGIARCFKAIYGDRADYPSHNKGDLLARLLAEQAILPARAWMVGDRTFDFDAARVNGVRSLAAGWGYGSPQEYAQADVLAAEPADLFALVCAPAPGSISR